MDIEKYKTLGKVFIDASKAMGKHTWGDGSEC